jgi:hypothetical protein
VKIPFIDDMDVIRHSTLNHEDIQRLDKLKTVLTFPPGIKRRISHLHPTYT